MIRNIVLYASVCLLAIGALWLLGGGSRDDFGFDNTTSEASHLGVWGIVCSVISMLGGIICGTMYDTLSKKDGRVTAKELVDGLASRAMIRAFVVSPIVFFALLSNLKGVQDFIMAITFAFQNGFFWQKTISPSTTSNRTTSDNSLLSQQ
jgi:hypothetical protein